MPIPPVGGPPLDRLPIDVLLENLPPDSPLRDFILSSSTLSPTGGDFVINDPDEGDEQGVATATLSNGNVIVIWNDYEGPYTTDGGQIHGQLLDSSGSPIGPELVLTSGHPVHFVDFEVAALANGNFVVTWTTNDLSADGHDQAIMAQIFASDGTALTADFRVNSQNFYDQHWPDVAALEGGGFVVVWTDEIGDLISAGDPYGWGIRAQIYAADGTPVGPEIAVNTTTAEYQYYPTVTGLSGGGFVVSWSDTSPSSPQTDVRIQVFSATGEMVGSELTLNSDPSVSQQHSDVARLNDGGFVVVWRQFDNDTGLYSIRGQQFDPSNNPVGSEFTVYESSVELDLRPDVVGLEYGGFAVTWESGVPGEEDVMVRSYHDWDDPWTDPMIVDDDAGRQVDSGITAVGGGFLVTWLDTPGPLVGEIEGRVYDLVWG